MLAKHTTHLSTPIPPHIPSTAILAALHNHTTTLTLQALTTSHTPLPTTSPSTLKDPFWHPPTTNPLSSYRVTETIAFLPYFAWARYSLTFPSVFQSTPTGLKTRAESGGVVLRAEYRVVPSSTVEGEGEVGWVLVEDVQVVCAWWMMPFVRGKMEEAHRDICTKVVEKVEREVEEPRREGGGVEEKEESGHVVRVDSGWGGEVVAREEALGKGMYV